jgi:hypothetical protein
MSHPIRIAIVVLIPFIVGSALAAGPGLKPQDLPADETIWPNQTSYRNSDPWLVKNHDKIRRMEPRVLVINFANTHSIEQIQAASEKYAKALSVSSRYHGFENAAAPAFLNYKIVKYVDMRDRPIPAERAKNNSAFFPYLPKGTPGQNFDYAQLYSEAFAKFYGFRDPDDHTRYLTLGELINSGFVHELWFHALHDEYGSPFESIEDKQYYDKNLKPIKGKHGAAGNGHFDKLPWVGRSFRITFLNVQRGVGCGLESASHAFEGIANHNAIAYFKPYFDEFAELDLNKRYPELPERSLYGMLGQENHAEYPDATTMVIHSRGKTYRCEDYICKGGNVHFMPGARNHYDLETPFVVKTVLETWREGKRPGEDGPPHDFDISKIEPYADVAPDCMGRWLVYWRQCVPGLDNEKLDDGGRPMKNWWVFLYY